MFASFNNQTPGASVLSISRSLATAAEAKQTSSGLGTAWIHNNTSCLIQQPTPIKLIGPVSGPGW